MCLNAGAMGRQDSESETLIPVAGGGFDVAPQLYSLMPMNSGKDFKARPVDVAQPLMAAGQSHGDQGGDVIVTHSLRADGFDASEDGTGRGTPLVPVAFQHKASAHQSMNPGEIAPALDTAKAGGTVVAFSAKDHGADAGELAPTLRAGGHSKSHANAGVMPAVAFAQNQRDEVRQMDVAGALAGEPGMKQQTYLQQASAVRRLTPVECEKLQGFPPGYTDVPYRGKRAADGPRYKSLGNSFAVPVVRWIGERIQAVENIGAKLGKVA